MIAFLQTYGVWIAYGAIFWFMMRRGCGMGMSHGQGGFHQLDEPRDTHGVTSLPPPQSEGVRPATLPTSSTSGKCH